MIKTDLDICRCGPSRRQQKVRGSSAGARTGAGATGAAPPRRLTAATATTAGPAPHTLRPAARGDALQTELECAHARRLPQRGWKCPLSFYQHGDILAVPPAAEWLWQPSLGYTQGTGKSQVPQSKYAELLAIIKELGKEIRPTYAGSKSAMKRLKRGIIHARGLVRECLAKTEQNARS